MLKWGRKGSKEERQWMTEGTGSGKVENEIRS